MLEDRNEVGQNMLSHVDGFVVLDQNESEALVNDWSLPMALFCKQLKQREKVSHADGPNCD